MGKFTMTDDELKRAGLAPYCPCGSGEAREPHHDARGIFLCYACDTCGPGKLAGYRPDVLVDPAYPADDLGDDEGEFEPGMDGAEGFVG